MGASQPGADDVEAECRAAIEAGDVDRWYGLGLLLGRQPGREREAERAFRSAIEAGDTRAWTDLGDLLSRQTDGWSEAERTYREPLEAGDGRAWISLGNLLYKHRGRAQEAEEAYRAAIAAGYPGGWLGIANLRARERGGAREAEQVYREALASGWIEAADTGMLWRNLGHLLLRQWGRTSEAEEAYRNAIDAGEDSAWYDLGWLLAKQPTRWDEARLAYGAAIEAGHPSASSKLSALLRKQQRRARVSDVVRPLRRLQGTASRFALVMLIFCVALVMLMLQIAGVFQPLIDGGVAMLEFWHGVTGNWGLAIILLAFTIQFALLPVSFTWRASKDKLDALEPERKELEERYAGDKERLHEEIVSLYARRKAGRVLAFSPIWLLLGLGLWVAGFYLFESQAFEDAIGGSEPFLFLPDLAQPLRDDPFVLAAAMALYMGIAGARRRLEPALHGSTRAWWAWYVTWLILFIFFPAGFIVFLIAESIWGVGEVLVLNSLLPRPAAFTTGSTA